MNKILNINLGGLPFVVDDSAYELLQKYTDGLRRVFATNEGRDEIIADIESRMAELISQNLGTKPIVSMKEVEAAIAVLGRPEQLDDDPTNDQESSATHSKSTSYSPDSKLGKRLFRDEQDAVIAGVCSGVAQYFGISDPLWVRLAFVLMSFTFGSAIILYAILWAIVPKASSAADRLSMRGEEVNVNNIAKEVEDGFERLSRRMSDFGDEAKKKGDQFMGSGAGAAVGSSVGRLIRFVGRLVIGFIKLWIWFLLAVVFFALLAGWIGLIWGFLWGKPALDYVSPFSTTMSYLGIFAGFLVAAIPLFALILLFSKRIFRTQTPRWLAPSLSATWLASAVFLIGIVSTGVGKFRNTGSLTKNIDLSEVRSDTLHVEGLGDNGNGEILVGQHGGPFARWSWDNDDEYDENRDWESVKLYDDHISVPLPKELRIKRTSGSQFELQQTFRAQGSSSLEAQELVSKVVYPVRIEQGKLFLPTFINIPKGEKWRVQRVDMTLFVPIGKFVSFGKFAHNWVQNVDYADSNDDNWIFANPNRIYKMTEKGLTCPTCPAEGDFQKGRYDDFSNLTIEGNLDVEIEHSDWRRSIEIEGGPTAEKLVHFNEDGDRLTIASKTDGTGQPIRILIKTPNLDRVFAENFNEINLRGFNEGEMELTFLNGKSVRAMLDVNRLTLKQIGQNAVKLIGKNDELNATLGDGATLDAAAFSSDRATVKANGKSTATVNADDFISKKLDETSVVKNVGKATGEGNQE